ncbi:MAG: MFS transporter [Rhodothermales bacterium]
MQHSPSPELGLKANLGQFMLLVAVNAFVGAMVGLERVIIPVLAGTRWGVESYVAALSFIITFGMAKVLANSVAGRLAERAGRKRLLILGWLLGIPVPLILMWAPSWAWVVAANALLGLNQGFAWTMTVVMKIDLVGPKQRGLALGINESAGYAAVSLAALLSGFWLAAGHEEWAFTAGLVIALVGLVVSLVAVHDTMDHVALEQGAAAKEASPSWGSVFQRVSWKERHLHAASQAGLVNNMNDGLAWGILPLFFLQVGMGEENTVWLLAAYPLIWGLGQLFTGGLSDRIGRRGPIAVGMILQGVSILWLLEASSWTGYAVSMVGMGIGTALVYPTLLAVISDHSEPIWRSTALGVYRLWRDGGYVVGAVLAGLLADALNPESAILWIGVLTIASGCWAGWLLRS